MNYKGFEDLVRTSDYTIWCSRRNPALSILEQDGRFRPSCGSGYVGLPEGYLRLSEAIEVFNHIPT